MTDILAVLSSADACVRIRTGNNEPRKGVYTMDLQMIEAMKGKTREERLIR